MQNTELESALRLLGAQPEDSALVIKRKYRALVRRYHPDETVGAGGETGPENSGASAEALRRIIRAYETVRSAPPESLRTVFRQAENAGRKSDSRRSTDSRQSADLRKATECNPAAFCPRVLYGSHDLFGEEQEDLYVRGTDRYYWDPDEEEFLHFLKSVNQAARGLLRDTADAVWADWSDGMGDVETEDAEAEDAAYRLKLFHLLVQEYIRPLSCLEKLAESTEKCADGSTVYEVSARMTTPVGMKDSLAQSRTAPENGQTTQSGAGQAKYDCVLSGTKICAVLPDGTRQQISLEEDGCYYPLAMMMARNTAVLSAQVQRKQNTPESAKGQSGRRTIRNRRKTKETIRLILRVHVTDPERASAAGCSSAEIKHLLEEYRYVLSH